MLYRIIKPVLVFFFLAIFISVTAQFRAREINWNADGNSYMRIKDGNIVKVDVKTNDETVLVKKDQLIPAGTSKPLSFNIYSFSTDNKKLLIYTNTAKVWRYNTRGDYWVLDI